MSEWWVDLSFACGLVVIVDESGVIVETMPVLYKFRGQHISRLEAWPPFRERRLLTQPRVSDCLSHSCPTHLDCEVCSDEPCLVHQFCPTCGE